MHPRPSQPKGTCREGQRCAAGHVQTPQDMFRPMLTQTACSREVCC
jgi:hypothetical protein